jgi:hypothetical protein
MDPGRVLRYTLRLGFDVYDPSNRPPLSVWGVSRALLRDNPMMTETRNKPAVRVSLAGLLAKAGAKDRANIEKHLSACDPAHAAIWQKLAEKLCELVALPVQTIGAQALTFFIPDGKYRLQVFALEDDRNGQILLYLPDVLSDAVKGGILTKTANVYTVGDSKRPLAIETLSAENTPDPARHVKFLIGWDRKALKITIDTAHADNKQTKAIEAMCVLAAKKWPAPVR